MHIAKITFVALFLASLTFVSTPIAFSAGLSPLPVSQIVSGINPQNFLPLNSPTSLVKPGYSPAALTALVYPCTLKAFAFFFVVGSLAPGLIATIRKHDRTFAIWIISLCAGWTIVGWISAFVWACGDPTPCLSFPVVARHRSGEELFAVAPEPKHPCGKAASPNRSFLSALSPIYLSDLYDL